MERRKRRTLKTRPWHPAISHLILRKDARSAGYGNAREALRRLVKLLGNNQAGALIGVAKSQPSRWLRGEPISNDNERRILDLDYVIGRALRVIHADKVGAWLTYQVPALGWARPIDVLVTEGPEAVVRALDVVEEGALL
jgi:uncharacterized protein (DUF2384 family)